jgi:hypothetical protein
MIKAAQYAPLRLGGTIAVVVDQDGPVAKDPARKRIEGVGCGPLTTS